MTDEEYNEAEERDELIEQRNYYKSRERVIAMEEVNNVLEEWNILPVELSLFKAVEGYGLKPEEKGQVILIAKDYFLTGEGCDINDLVCTIEDLLMSYPVQAISKSLIEENFQEAN